MGRCGLFEAKPLSVMQVLPLAACYALCTPLSNLSLAFNSVGFYQMMKILTTPYVAIIQGMFYGVVFSSQIRLALAIVVVGVIFATVNDVEVNLRGTVYAVACMIVTAQYQIYVGTKQKELGVNSTQLLTNMVPVSAVIALILTPFLDNTGLFGTPDGHSLMEYEFTMASIVAVLGSAVLAVFVNLSIFLVIGATSAVTYNVVGHFKTILVLSFSFIMFHYAMDAKNILGMAIALAGMVMYTHYKIKAQNAAKAAAPAATSPSTPNKEAGTDVEMQPLKDGAAQPEAAKA